MRLRARVHVDVPVTAVTGRGRAQAPSVWHVQALKTPAGLNTVP